MFNDDDEYGGFSVKFEDTEHNREVYKQFKQFAKEETQDNYLLAIKTLLDYYENDYKFKSLYDKVEQLAFKVEELQQRIEEEDNETTEDDGVF